MYVDAEASGVHMQYLACVRMFEPLLVTTCHNRSRRMALCPPAQAKQLR